MALIANTGLGDTFDFWRRRTNDVNSRLESLSGQNDTLTLTGNVVVDTSTFVVNATTNRVGVGKATPLKTFDVLGEVAISANLVVDTNTLYVDAVSKKVGIACTTPTVALDVVGATALSSTLDVVGATALSSTLDVTGDSTLVSLNANAVTLTGDLTINATDIDKPINITNVDTVANTTHAGSIYLTYNSSGADLVSGGNKSKTAFRIDGNYSATGGTTVETEQLNIYNSYITSTNSGDAFAHIAQYTYADTEHDAGNVYSNHGTFSIADALNTGTGTITYNAAFRGLSRLRSDGDVTNTYGGIFNAQVMSGASASGNILFGAEATAYFEPGALSSITNVRGGSFNVNIQEGTATTAMGVYSYINLESAAAVTSNAFLYYGRYEPGSLTEIAGAAYGLYMTGEESNWLDGSLRVGGDLDLVGNVTSALDVDGLATFTNGIDVTGSTTFQSGFLSLADIKLNDSVDLFLGSDNDARFFHDGSSLYLDMANDDAFYWRDVTGGTVVRFTFAIGTGDFTATGDVNVGGEVVTTSDERFKNNVININSDDALKTVAALRPVSYTRDNSAEINYGLLAQDVAKVLPDIVRGNEEDGYSLAYTDLIAVLIGAVQDLDARVKELEV